jgi:hypothetical protein
LGFQFGIAGRRVSNTILPGIGSKDFLSLITSADTDDDQSLLLVFFEEFVAREIWRAIEKSGQSKPNWLRAALLKAARVAYPPLHPLFVPDATTSGPIYRNRINFCDFGTPATPVWMLSPFGF